MKKIFKTSLIFIFTLGILFSCEDAKDPWNSPTSKEGPFIVLDEVVQSIFDISDIANAKYIAKLSDPAGSVAKYDLYASLNMGDTVFVKSLTSFPTTLTVTSVELATALGITIADFAEGDVIDFVAETSDRDGNVYTLDNLDGDVLNPGMKQGFTYSAYVACPSAIEGMYDGHTDWIDYYGGADSYDYEVNLTKAGAVFYNLADLSGGMEPIIWDNPKVAAVIMDICGTIILSSAPYGYGYYIDGPYNTFGSGSNIDPGTGVITIYWENEYAEYGVTVLTPQ